VRRRKYNNKRTEYNGRAYDSKAEAERAMALDVACQSGDLLYWQPQVTFPLGPDDSLRVDFLVWYRDGSVRAEDVKGFETREFKRKRRLWTKYAPCPLCIVKRAGRGWTVETVYGQVPAVVRAAWRLLGGVITR
jgi:hypothetical protein